MIILLSVIGGFHIKLWQFSKNSIHVHSVSKVKKYKFIPVICESMDWLQCFM